jgi:hypothetical protein
MNTASKAAGIVLMLCVLASAGCQKKVELTFFNHTDAVLPVKVTTPEHGTIEVGSIGAHGSQLRYTVRIKTDDLPAQCSCAVGLTSKTFTVSEDTQDALWFHLDNKGLAGPMDKGTKWVGQEKTVDVKTTIKSETIVE